MAPFIEFPIDLARTATALEGICTQLSRAADALERLSPAPPISYADSKPASLSDLRHTDPSTVSSIKRELETFAHNSNVVLDSDAFIQSIINYEKEVALVYGNEAIRELPWNKAAGGPIFQDSEGNGIGERLADSQVGQATNHAQPASGSTTESEHQESSARGA